MARYRKDSGDAIFIVIFISLIFILVITGLVVDIGKNVVMKGNYNNYAQESAEVAVKEITARGSLNEKAYQTFVREYVSKTYSTTPAGLNAINPKTGRPVLETGCKLKIPTSGGAYEVIDYTGPYFELSLSDKRAGGTKFATVKGTANEVINQTARIAEDLKAEPTKLRVLNVTMYESTPNFLLGMAGFPCQQFNVEVSSIAFGSQEDLL